MNFIYFFSFRLISVSYNFKILTSVQANLEIIVNHHCLIQSCNLYLNKIRRLKGLLYTILFLTDYVKFYKFIISLTTTDTRLDAINIIPYYL